MEAKSIVDQEEVGNIEPNKILNFQLEFLLSFLPTGYNAEEIGNTLLDMVDPKRHIHPGIPYDFYDGYIVVIGESGVLPKPASRFGHSSIKPALSIA